jgi:molybdopterin molybdotransferase
VEETERAGSDVQILKEFKAGFSIRPRGEDVKSGELVIRAGTRIGPAEMGMLASLGMPEVPVRRKPRAAVVTSGSELVDASQRPGPGQIRDSNRFSLLGQVLRAGGQAALFQRVVDERGELEEKLAFASQEADLIIVSGGVSVGDYDFVKDTLAKLGDIRFWRLKIKPGKPFVFGQINGKPLFGLPGNPVSSMVTFDLFVRPAILRMMGMSQVQHPVVSGRVSAELRHRPGVREFVRATTTWEAGGYVAVPTGIQGSGRLSSMLKANSYVVIPEDAKDIPAGAEVRIVLLG